MKIANACDMGRFFKSWLQRLSTPRKPTQPDPQWAANELERLMQWQTLQQPDAIYRHHL